MNRIDVLHVIDSLGEGGAENNLLSVIRRLPAAQFRNHVAWLGGGTSLVSALTPYVDTFVPIHASGILAAAGELTEWLRSHRPAVVSAQLLMSHLVSRLSARAIGIPLVTTWQNTIFDDSAIHEFGGSAGLRGMLLALDRETAGYESAYIAVSEYVARRWVETLNVPADRVTVIPNAVEPSRYRSCTPDELAQTRAQLNLPDDAEIILSVGRLVKPKGHLEALAAMPAILRARPRAHLLIAGSGPLETELRQNAGERVRILGQRSDLPCLYGVADAFLFATHYEGLSLALVELIAAGLPGAVSDIPPNREVADGLPSIQFFPVGDVTHLAKAVIAVLSGGKEQARAVKDKVGARFSPDHLALKVGVVLQKAARCET